MNIKGHCHSLIMVQGHSDSTFPNFFFLETARPIEAKFHVEPQWNGGTKVCSNGPAHMTNMATMHIYGKNLKKLSSLEPKGIKYLGVKIRNDLRWNTHVSSVCTKADRNLGFLR